MVSGLRMEARVAGERIQTRAGNEKRITESKCRASQCTGSEGRNQMSLPTARMLGDPRRKKLLLGTVVVLLAALIVVAALLHHYWPFTESAIAAELSAAAASDVHFGSFHDQYFPPGCVAENVVFQRKGSEYPFITIQRLTIRSYPAGILRNHVSLLRAEGMHVMVGRRDFGGANTSVSKRTIDELIADGAILEIRQRAPEQNLRFTFHNFELKNLGGGSKTSFSAVFDNPLPAGLIRTSGQFGPWNSARLGETALSGKYTLENADLGVFDGIGGRVSSTGEFGGTAKQMEVEGSTRSDQFEVAKTHHSLPLKTDFKASLDVTSGDVELHQVRARFGRNQIDASGTIGPDAHGKRKAVVELRCDRGRIEDIFYPFIKSPRSPLTGDAEFKMRVTIPGGPQKFVAKLDLQSSFEIKNARFTREETQERLNKIAESPDQHQPTETLSDFHGTVEMRQGIAHFSYLSVEDQSASAMFRGSYGIEDERVNMQGKLKTATSLTKATHGFSAVFAKVLEPFFKKSPHVNVVPVKISGTYSHPSFGLDINSKM